MSYSNPQTISYTFANEDFGAGADDNYIIVGPPGKAGRVREISAVLREAVVGTTSGGFVYAGTSADPDAYAALSLPNGTAADAFLSASSQASPLGVNLAEIPANGTSGASVHIDTIATVGGTVTGIADVTVVIDWY